MNDSVRDITVSGDVFFAQAGIRRDEIIGMEPVVINLPVSHTFAPAFVQQAPGVEATVTIQFLDIDDNPDSLKLLFKGFVKSVNFSDDNQYIRLQTEPVSVGLEAEIPMDTYSPQCQTALFSSRCGVSKAAFTFSGVVSAEAGNVITVTGLEAAHGDGWAVPGTVEFGSLVVQVFSQDGDDLTLALPFSSPVLGETVGVTAGCDGLISTCVAKFNNVANFRGFPYVPTENIFITGLQ